MDGMAFVAKIQHPESRGHFCFVIHSRHYYVLDCDSAILFRMRGSFFYKSINSGFLPFFHGKVKKLFQD